MGHDDINVGANQLGRQFGKPRVIPLRPAILNDNVFAFRVTKIAQTKPKSIELLSETGRRRSAQKPNPGDLDRLLRERWKRCREGARTKCSDQFAAFVHSITSSTRTSRDCGSTKPVNNNASAAAQLRI